MSNFFARQAVAYKNELNQSFASLIGICTGIVCDKALSDGEIRFLDEWLESHSAMATAWPGDVIHARIKAALADGVITEEEREHLMNTLRQLVGGTLDQLAESAQVTQLALDAVHQVEFAGASFCFTGDFVFSTRSRCEAQTEALGGRVVGSVSKKLRYLVVGGLGSPEWKHGAFGTKIETAMKLKSDGANILVVHEDVWAKSLPRLEN